MQSFSGVRTPEIAKRRTEVQSASRLSVVASFFRGIIHAWTFDSQHLDVYVLRSACPCDTHNICMYVCARVVSVGFFSTINVDLYAIFCMYW